MTAELIYMREDGDDGLELTSREDVAAVAYVRADLAGNLHIKEKRDLFSDSDDCNTDMREPCKWCEHNDTDEWGYPCAACKHG